MQIDFKEQKSNRSLKLKYKSIRKTMILDVIK